MTQERLQRSPRLRIEGTAKAESTNCLLDFLRFSKLLQIFVVSQAAHPSERLSWARKHGQMRSGFSIRCPLPLGTEI